MSGFFSNRIKKWKKITQLLVASIGLFCSSCVCFCSGTVNENTIIESTAVDVSKYVSLNSKTKYLSIQVSPKNAEAKRLLPNTYNEYFYWKYIFRHSDFGFLSTVNGGKTHDCYFGEIDVNENISFLSCGNNSNPEFDGFYKHEVYDIKLMFKGRNIINQDAINFLVISQTRAKQLLLKRGEIADSDGNYSLAQYEKLLGTNTRLVLDGNSHNFSIANVFFESGPFHDNVSQNFGEYVLSYIHFPDGMESEATYIFNAYDYQNIHKLKRMRALFDSSLFSFNMSLFNLRNSGSSLLDIFDSDYFFGGNLGNGLASIALSIFSLVILSVFLYVFWQSESIHNTKSVIAVISSFLLPYAVLFLINSIIKIPLIFSYFSLVIYSIMFVVLIAVLIATLFRERGDRIRKIL